MPVIIASARRIGRRVRHTTRRGQDKLAEIQNIVQETITGDPHCEGLRHGALGNEIASVALQLDKTARSQYALDRGVQAVSSPLDGCAWCRGDCTLLLLFGRNAASSMETGRIGTFMGFLAAVILLYDPVRKMPLYYNSFQQAVGASEEIFRFLDAAIPLRDEMSALRA